MTEFSSTSFPKPLNWQDFERHCRVLFEFILRDPNVQLNGRAGQSQNGVDIWGKRDGRADHWVGVQCKGKNDDYHGTVTEKELRNEVEKARGFKPHLSEFILVTTAPDDAKIQEIARCITQENEATGKPMEVNVWGWGTLQSRISQSDSAIKAFYPDALLSTDKIIEKIDEVKAETEITHQLNTEILATVKSFQAAVLRSSDSSTKEIEVIDKYLHSDIDNYRDLIKEGRPQTAIVLLENLKTRCWGNASDRVKFRIITNIGAAKLRLGDEKGAAADFLAASKHDPFDKIGMSNVVLAHMLVGRIPEAIAAAESALRQDSMNENAASYLIQSYSCDDSVTDPFTLVSTDLRDTAAVRMGVISFFRRRGNPDWHKAALDAVALFPNEEEIKRAAAEARLDTIMATRGFLLGEPTTAGDDVNILIDVTNFLETLWNKVKGSEVSCADTDLPHNLAVSYRALGKHDLAAKVLDEALGKKPNAINLVILRAALHLESVKDEDEAALRLIQECKVNNPVTAIMKGELLLKRNPSAAREAIRFLDMPADNEAHRLEAARLIIQSYILENNRPAAFERAERLVSEYPYSTTSLISLYGVQDHFGDKLANETLTKAKNLLNDDSPFYDRFILAHALEKYGRYDEIVDALNGKVDYLRDTSALQLLLSAMINSDQRKQAHKVIKLLPKEIADKPFYLRIQVALHIMRGDYGTAEHIVEHYLQVCPEELTMRLRWIDLRMRRGGETDVKNFFKGKVEKLKGTPFERMRLALLLNDFGFNERGLKLGYEVFLKNRRDPQIHLKYVALLLRPHRSDDINLELTEIKVDAVFTIKNSRNEQATYIIEPDEEIRIDENYIPPDHPIAIKTLGLKVNDVFVIHDKREPIEKWCITTIKHKYLYVLHNTMENFERQFPTVGGLERIVTEGEGHESLQPILSRVKKRHDAIEAAFDQYVNQQNPLPLELLAHIFGGDIIQIWQCLITTGRTFRVCVGTFEERAAAIKAIEANKLRGCVVDALTFYILRRMKLEKAISVVCGPIGLTEAVVDIFRCRREEILTHIGNPFMSVYWRNGQFYREEVSEQQLQQALGVVDDDLAWIKNNCEILPAEGTYDLPPHLRNLSRKLHNRFFDTLLAADGTNRLLLCEDFIYRSIAAGQPGIRASWIQPVLMLARQHNLITIAQYSEAVISMIESGFIFTSIDAQVLLAATQDKNGEDVKIFAKVAKIFGGHDIDVASHTNVAINYFNIIWKNGEPALKYKAQTSMILEGLLKGRRAVFNGIAKNLFIFVPNDEFRKYLIGWLQGHFIIPFNALISEIKKYLHL